MADPDSNPASADDSRMILNSGLDSIGSVNESATMDRGPIRMSRKVSEAKLRLCPRVNCPEKIIICIDVSQEMDTISFRSRAGDKFSPIKLAKRALGMFVHSKHKMDSRHQFAVVLMHNTAEWAAPFTHNPSDIIAFLDDLKETSPTESCNLASLLEVINDHVALPHVLDVTSDPPPYTIRTIFIYGRSHCIPTLEQTDVVEQLQSSPHFFLDIYYTHEPPSQQNKCEAIFDQLCDLDVNGLYYVYEVSRNPTKVYDCMAQLLAHPLQRPLQKDTQYYIELPGLPAEMRG